MFSYREILKKSLGIIWRHKYLWFFGLFASILGGMGSYKMPFSSSAESWNSSMFSGLGNFSEQTMKNGGAIHGFLQSFLTDPKATSIGLSFLIILAVLLLFLLWLAIVSEAGLINNAAKIIKSNGQKIKTTISEGLRVGNNNFWSVLGYNLIAACFIVLFASLAGLPLVFLTASASPFLSFFYILLFIIFIPLALIVYFLAKYATCYKVLKNKHFLDSIVSALKLFKKNWIVSLEMALIIFVIDILSLIALILAGLILAIPYVFIAAVLTLVCSPSILVFAIIVAMLFACIVVVLYGAILTTFKTVAWTEVFMNLSEKKAGLSKIERLAHKKKK